MIKHKISAQQLASTNDAARLLKNVALPSENLCNLFEVPVLFYAAILTLYTTGMANELYLVLASGYVVLRYIHSFIHITYNNVLHRFTAYVVSTLLLWSVWIMIGIDIIQHRL